MWVMSRYGVAGLHEVLLGSFGICFVGGSLLLVRKLLLQSLDLCLFARIISNWDTNA